MTPLARLLLVLVLAFAAAGPAGAADGDSDAIRLAGQPVDFVRWQPSAREYNHTVLAPDGKWRREIEKNGEDALDSLIRVHVHFRADGAIERTVLTARLFLTADGVRDSGNLTFWVDSFAETATIDQAYALTANNRVIAVEPATIQMVQDPSDDVFHDSFLVHVPFSGLAPGSVAVLRWKSVIKPGS